MCKNDQCDTSSVSYEDPIDEVAAMQVKLRRDVTKEAVAGPSVSVDGKGSYSIAKARVGGTIWKDRKYSFEHLTPALQGATLFKGPVRIPEGDVLTLNCGSKGGTFYALLTPGRGGTFPITLPDAGWTKVSGVEIASYWKGPNRDSQFAIYEKSGCETTTPASSGSDVVVAFLHVDAQPLTVEEVFKKYTNPVAVSSVNNLFYQLPANDQEEEILNYILPHTKDIYTDFVAKTKEGPVPEFKKKQSFEERLGYFQASVKDIIKLSNEAQKVGGPNPAKFGIGKFADWTFDEFKGLLDPKNPKSEVDKSEGTSLSQARSQIAKGTEYLKGEANRSVMKARVSRSRAGTPCNKNWAAEAPHVYKAREQGSCSSCYAHAAAECLRAHAFINTGMDPGELSVQYTLDCTNGGKCNGGYAGDTMDIVAQKGGIPTKVDYGAYHVHAETCHPGVPLEVTTSGSKWTYAEEESAKALCEEGPVAMGVAVNWAFQHYQEGVLSHSMCPAVWCNHDTQVVGLIEEEGAWLIRNSWGEDWGINPVTLQPGGSAGFIMLEYGQNTCNVEEGNAYPKDVKFTSGCTMHAASCEKAYHFAPKGAYKCDYGENVNQLHCEEAVLAMAKEAGATPKRSLQIGKGGKCKGRGWGAVPLGCSTSTGSDWTAHYKVSGSSGPGCAHEHYQLICTGSGGPLPEEPAYNGPKALR